MNTARALSTDDQVICFVCPCLSVTHHRAVLQMFLCQSLAPVCQCVIITENGSLPIARGGKFIPSHDDSPCKVPFISP